MASTIDLMYSLTREQIYTSLNKSGIYRNRGPRVILETVLLFICGAAFLYSCIQEFSVLNLIFTIISFGFMALVILVPRYSMKKQAKAQAGKKFKLRVGRAKLSIEEDGQVWEMKLDGTSQYKLLDQLILLITPNQELVVLPVESFPLAYKEEIKERIFSGTYEAQK